MTSTPADTTTATTPRPPEDEAERPLVSICVPCLNEELTIGEFVDWCHQGLAEAGVSGEVVIVDSSTDRSPEIAEAHGARVLRFPKRGLGRAYIDAIPHLRGEYVILGDCDLTYDFRVLSGFVEQLQAGSEFVMGSRFRGSIEAGAMPALHQHFGTPVTTWIFNRIYGTRFSDIHCGMRGLRVDALRRIDLTSQGWEYASEMILKATKLHLRTAEVPIHFLKDRDGRQSHHLRSGWLSPWKAGWDNLRIMFLYAPDRLLSQPGVVLLALGLALMLAVTLAGAFTIAGVGIGVQASLLGLALATVGLSAWQLGTVARVRSNLEPAFRRRVLERWTYNRGALIATLMVLVGFALEIPLLVDWLGHGSGIGLHRESVLGIGFALLGAQTFGFTLLLQIVAGPAYTPPNEERTP
ncbi:MAG TPA: glycosyltransferase family 2 protein [Baekduia sp.]|nr:glycosyltransferase family 2 protein [Baekduia sp.]